MEEMYRLFTKGDKEIVQSMTETKLKTDSEFKTFNIKLVNFDWQITDTLKKVDISSIKVVETDKKVQDQI